MSWEVDKEYTESTPQYQPEPPFWKKTWKYFVVGVICFSVGFSISNNRSKYFVKRNQTLTTENHELKETIRKYERTPAETVLVPYTVLVTDAVKESKETAPVTDAVATETEAAKKETAAETTKEPLKKEDLTEDKVRAALNPLTKKAMAPRQVNKADDWKDYWIEVKRSDLFGMKPDDLKFFYDYINENCAIEGYFYVIVTDVPGLSFEFSVTKNEYIRSSEEFFAGIDQKKSDTPYLDVGSCAIRVNDPDHFEVQGLCKDEYGLERFDDDKIYHFSEFNDDMFAKLDELQEYAKKLWG